MSHLSITDHGTNSGHRAFQRAADAAGVIPILGQEGYFSSTDRFDRRSKAKREDGTQTYNHITLLAQNSDGLDNLNTLSRLSWTEGFYSKSRVDFDLLEEYNKGIVVLSGCMSGVVARNILNGDLATAKHWAKRFKDTFGDRYFIEIMSSNEKSLNHALLDIADELHIGPVLTGDCHYANKEDLWVEDAMLILQTNPTKDKTADFTKSQKMDFMERYNYLYPGRTMTFQEIEIYLRSHDTEVAQFKAQGIDRDDIFSNTNLIASTIGDYPYHSGLDLLPTPEPGDPAKILRSKAMHGLKKLGLDLSEEHVARLEHELAIINKKKFDRYFLVVADILNFCKEKGIITGPGRGSAAGALTCYVLGITLFDPLKYGALFERFIDESRDDLPDIDIDIQKGRRGEVKQYLIDKYTHAAAIATFGDFKGKSSIKAAARVFGVKLSETNRATKEADSVFEGETFFREFENNPIGRDYARKYPEVMRLARQLSDRISNKGMHASGMIVSKEPIAKYAPIETATNKEDDNAPRVEYVALDMRECADIGFVKLDILGLKTLDVINDAINNIVIRHGKQIDPWALPLNDKNVYQMLSDGYTTGVFQCEQSAYTSLIFDIHGVKDFDELVATNALVRPGAKNTIGKQYIARKLGKESVTYLHPVIKEFTENTYGMATVFQEQTMQLVQKIGGLTAKEANELRRGIGKKEIEYIRPFKQKFLDGASTMVSEKQAEQLWSDIEAGAGYSFNIAHSVAYSLISYATAWLKCNYPLEYMAAAITNEQDSDKMTDYLIEAKRLGVKVLLPHVNSSQARTEIVGEGIRMGLTNVKFVGAAAAQHILKKRPFESFAHLNQVASAKGSGISTRVVGSLDKIGGCKFEDNPLRGDEREHLYEYLSIPEFQMKEFDPSVEHKFRKMADFDEKGAFAALAVVRRIKQGDGWARANLLDETGNNDAFVGDGVEIEAGKMYALLICNNRIVKAVEKNDLLLGNDTGAFSKYLYGRLGQVPEDEFTVLSFKSRKTKAGKLMGDVVLIDDIGLLQSAIVFPDSRYSEVYTKAKSKFRPGANVKVILNQLDDGGLTVKDIK